MPINCFMCTICKYKYKDFINSHRDFEGLERFCNICGYRFSKFLNFNNREAMCPVCGSLERHRHLAIHLFSIYPFLQNKKILHFAPEQIIKNILINSSANYYDADLDTTRAKYNIDITKIDFPDNTFDYIICIHVLEHIVDDIKALNEIYRVLKPHGIAYLAVPCFNALHEDYSITDPKEREKIYGQFDHVRKYDLDTFTNRIKSVGFSIKISDPQKFNNLFSNSVLDDDKIIISLKE